MEKVAPANALLAIAQARKHVETTYNKLQNAESLVGTQEQILNISERWTTESPEYKKYYQENVMTNYQDVIDHLERLLVMCSSELTKSSSPGTGIL